MFASIVSADWSALPTPGISFSGPSGKPLWNSFGQADLGGPRTPDFIVEAPIDAAQTGAAWTDGGAAVAANTTIGWAVTPVGPTPRDRVIIQLWLAGVEGSGRVPTQAALEVLGISGTGEGEEATPLPWLGNVNSPWGEWTLDVATYRTYALVTRAGTSVPSSVPTLTIAVHTVDGLSGTVQGVRLRAIPEPVDGYPLPGIGVQDVGVTGPPAPLPPPGCPRPCSISAATRPCCPVPAGPGPACAPCAPVAQLLTGIEYSFLGAVPSSGSGNRWNMVPYSSAGAPLVLSRAYVPPGVSPPALLTMDGTLGETVVVIGTVFTLTVAGGHQLMWTYNGATALTEVSWAASSVVGTPEQHHFTAVGVQTGSTLPDAPHGVCTDVYLAPSPDEPMAPPGKAAYIVLRPVVINAVSYVAGQVVFASTTDLLMTGMASAFAPLVWRVYSA